jgi:hypothetical protein
VNAALDSYPRLERPFRDGKLTIHVAPASEDVRLSALSGFLIRAHGGKVVKRLGAVGVDEVYWDLELAGHQIMLHAQQLLGTYVCATDDPSERWLADRAFPSTLRFMRKRQGWWGRLTLGVWTIADGVRRAR